MKIASRDWLTIREASRLLGVHIGTVREWADAGVLPSYRTAGGHRRFSAFGLEEFLNHQSQSPSDNHSSPREHALRVVRAELETHPLKHSPWFQHLGTKLSAEQRQQQREIGQHLLACVVAFVEEPEARDHFLDEGRRIAREYGRTFQANGLSAGNAARATIYFRQIILKTVLSDKLGSRTGDEEDARLFERVSAFLDEILLALLDAYQ
jgi:excisionase family DNA binding protein